MIAYRLLTALLIVGVSASGAIAQNLPNVDAIYDPKIRTVLLYPVVGTETVNPSLTLNPPVMSLDDNTPLQLEFDDLTGDYRSFRAKLVHCNTDWQRSVLNEIEFTYEYNDNAITEYQVSVNTKIPYYHYRFTVPRVKLPGNYLLVVYDERNPRNVIFTRRFSPYSNKLIIKANARFSTDPARQFQDQQIDFSIDYRGYQVISPQDDFKVIIRQNYRDDRTLKGLKPNNVRAFDQVVDYTLFDLTNTLPGGNEYRFFDTRTVLSQANYIDRIVRGADRTTAYVQVNQPRSRQAYGQTDDFNGQYIIDHQETGTGATSADYIETIFTLRTDEVPNAEVFVNGAFNLWGLNDRNRMTYDPATGAYRASIMLKQGVYNYNYSATGIPAPVTRTGQALAGGNEFFLEGDYAQTENDYEIFVYHRPPASRADQLVGYLRVGFNKRR
ncbi:MAG: DUF5103 domain-containing protein [Bacteroidetes bacterium]|nr:DUF5103 domain-containing protein [Fibrella sp.]